MFTLFFFVLQVKIKLTAGLGRKKGKKDRSFGRPNLSPLMGVCSCILLYVLECLKLKRQNKINVFNCKQSKSLKNINKIISSSIYI
jgi:hypothetical protein